MLFRERSCRWLQGARSTPSQLSGSGCHLVLWEFKIGPKGG
jgi:hypothetical protein